MYRHGLSKPDKESMFRKYKSLAASISMVPKKAKAICLDNGTYKKWCEPFDQFSRGNKLP